MTIIEPVLDPWAHAARYTGGDYATEAESEAALDRALEDTWSFVVLRQVVGKAGSR